MSESLQALSHRRPSVLLVEAEPMLRLTMTKFLRRSGYDVTAWPDADAAATALTQGPRPPSLIVLGVRVLDRETAAVARRLRQAAPDVPMLGIADVLHHHGGDAPDLPDNLRFLAHPFDMPDVLRAVRSSLRRSGFHKALGDPA
jgi:DNA-binding response OmpR family regulator